MARKLSAWKQERGTPPAELEQHAIGVYGPRAIVYVEAYDADWLSAIADAVDSLRFLTAAAETEPGMHIYRAHIDQARAILARIDGRID